MQFFKSLWIFIFAIVSDVSFANTIVVQNNNSENVQNIVVYLQPQFTGDFSSFSVSNKQYSIQQTGKKFTPYISVMMKGVSPQFTNEDDVTHHIYSAVGPKRFSFKLKADKSKNDITFNKSGHVAMGCNVHDWMSGHILVVDTPFFGKTNDLGVVEFNNIPAGKYKLNVWHPQLNAIDNTESRYIEFPLASQLNIQLESKMFPLPEQSSLDEFEFLEDY